MRRASIKPLLLLAALAGVISVALVAGQPFADAAGSLSKGSLTMISTRADGTSGPALPNTFGADEEAISDDGKVIAFISPIPAEQLVSDPLQTGLVNDTNDASDVFVWDSRVPSPLGPIVTLVSWNKTHTGTANAASKHPIMAPAGLGVVFESTATDLVTVAVGPSSDHLYAWAPVVSDIFPVFMVDENYQGTAGSDSLSQDASIAVTAVPPAAEVAFTSPGTDLVDPAVHDSHGVNQVYVRTLTLPSPSTVMASVGLDSSGTISGAQDPMIAANGIDVVFDSGGDDLVSGVTATGGNIFVRNLLTDSTSLISKASSGAQGTTGNGSPVISADGTAVAWDSNDTTLSDTPHNSSNHIFYRSGVGAVQMVDVDSLGVIGCDSASNNPGLSLDGTVVVFESFCDDIASFGTTGTQVYERRMSAIPSLPEPVPHLVSIDDAGTAAGNADSFLCPGTDPPHCGASTNPGVTVNADGTAIAFFSESSNIGAPSLGTPPFSSGNVFVRYPDLIGGGTTVNLAVNGLGTNPDDVSRDPVISSDGGSVAFVSLADDLVTPDSNEATDVFESDIHNSFFIQPITAVGEGDGHVTITVGRSGNAGTTDTVDVATGDGSIPALPLLPPEITDPANSNAVAPGDYTDTSETLTFPPGVLTQTFSVAINDDSLQESPELFHVSLSSGTGAGTVPLPGPLSDAYVVILDNDTPQDWHATVSQQAPASAQVGDTVTAKASISVDAGADDLSVTSLASGAGTSGLDQVAFGDGTPFTVSAGTSKIETITARVVANPGAGGVHLEAVVGGTLGATSTTKTAVFGTIATTEGLTATLTSGATDVALADQIIYTLTVTNDSDTPAQVTGLPAGFVAPAGTTQSTRADGLAAVPANGSSVWTLTVDVNDADTDGTVITQTPGALTYAMSAIGLASRSLVLAPATRTTTVQAPVVAVAAHTLTDANGGTLDPGDTVDVSVTVQNTGAVGATTATLSDALTDLQGPASIKLDGVACGACSSTSSSVTAPLGALDPLDAHVVTFTATVPASPVGTTSASAVSVAFSPATTGTSPTPTNTATLTIGSTNIQDWHVSISTPPPASTEVGDIVTVKATISVDAGANNLSVTALTAGAGTSGLDQVTYGDATPFTVDAGASKIETITARVVAAPGTAGIHLQVSVGGTFAASSTVKTTDTSAIASTEALTATITASTASVLITDQISYTVTVGNASDTPAQITGLPGGFLAPPGTTLASRVDGVTAVPANGSSVWKLTVDVDDSNTNGTSIAQVVSGLSYAMSAIALPARAITPSPASVSATVKAAVVAIGPHTLTDANGGTLDAGDAVNVSVTVSNSGAASTTATLNDTLSNLQSPAAIKLDGVACGACTFTSTSVTAPVGTLAAGGSHIVTFTATIPASPAGTTVSSSGTVSFTGASTGTSPTATALASLTISTPTPPSPSGTNTTTTPATTTTTTVAATSTIGTTTTVTTTTTASTPPLSVDLGLKVTAPRTGSARHNLVYVFTVTNKGPGKATGVKLSTKLTSGGARLISGSVICAHGVHLVCTIGTLAPGHSMKATIVLRARGPAPYKNVASVVGDQSDLNQKNNSLTAITAVARPSV
ncbi:MAG TPA: Calx-beta domain-containing protein [Gaiellaceae bacterium]